MRRLVLIGSLALILAAAFVLFMPPPQFLLRAVSQVSATAIMRGPAMTERGWRTVGTRLLGTYVQIGLASQVSDRLTAAARSDEEALYRIVRFVHQQSVNAEQLEHIPRSWPVLVSGLGYCDQINAAAATIAANRFDEAQIYATYDSRLLSSPHTIGRVWSSDRDEWLYFDAFYASPVIFTRDDKGRAHFLKLPRSSPRKGRGLGDPAIYSLPGWALADFHATLGTYVYSRASAAIQARMQKPPEVAEDVPAARKEEPAATPASRAVSKGAAAPRPAARPQRGGELMARPVLSAAASRPPPPIPPLVHRNDEAFEEIAREYLAVRVSEILGEPVEDGYRDLATHPKAELDDRAVQITEIAARLASLPIE